MSMLSTCKFLSGHRLTAVPKLLPGIRFISTHSKAGPPSLSKSTTSSSPRRGPSRNPQIRHHT
jgi:hypothetical protein